MRPALPRAALLLGLVGLLAQPVSGDPVAPSSQGERIRLAEAPALSPDGSRLAFGWRGDLWIAAATGGPARRLTSHPALDRTPRFSPDGTRLAFTSNRTGADQAFVLELEGGEPLQVTRHSEGSAVQGWFPDGRELLVAGRRDHDSDRPERFFRVEARAGAVERLLFDDWGYDGALSPDGKRLAFARYGTGWSRKGYRGSQAAQVWVHDLGTERFTRVSKGPHEERWPLWTGDGAGLRVVSGEDGTRNLVGVDLAHGSRACLTRFVDDGVTFPTSSADGRVFVFRVLADLYRMEAGGAPKVLELHVAGEPSAETERREELAKAVDVAFSADAREVAFTAGGDVWVMDTELREPRRVTDTPEEEREPVFSPDFQTLVFLSDAGGRTDVWKATRRAPERWWWQNEGFELARITDDAASEGSPRLTPDGATLLYTRSPGALWRRPLAGGEATLVVDGWDPPFYTVSPDGAWIAYVRADEDFNHDVWIAPLDASRPPFNVSVHPDNEGWPAWSPDGRLLAFAGRRWDRESDICYVWLRHEDDERDARERKLEKAVEKMKGRKPRAEPAKPQEPKPASEPAGAEPGAEAPEKATTEPATPADAPARGKDTKDKASGSKGADKPVEVRIDFEGLADRVRRIPIPDAEETDLLWSPDSKRLAFRASVKGQAGWHAVEIPDEPAPKSLTTTLLNDVRWLKEGDLLVGNVDGVPTTVAAAGGKVTSLGFRVRRRLDVRAFHQALFERAWLVMRDTWYDPRLNHRDAEALRAKYAPLAAAALTPSELDVVVDLFLGELNGSHLGFTMLAGSWNAPGWREVTGHLGARLLPPDGKPGREVRDVVRGTPAHEAATRLVAGERILSIDGTTLAPETDVEALLTGDPDREVEVRVAAVGGAERTVRLRPTTYAAVRAGLYEEGLEGCRTCVAQSGAGSLGYLHVRAMNQASFERFEAELYKVGHGKDGLIIDVRGNGGGFTADHLLTCLTQPRHATTIPRDGGQGYPHDRMVYAPWHKPVVVLIDQDSFSNAEIFAHAMRTLGRARLVGVTTAGGVISTGGTTLMGAATLRLPFRGWFLPNGEDMERNGCPPDVEVWPQPTELPRGIDRQLDKAVEVLLEDVRAWKARKPLVPRYASERDGPPPAGGR